MPVDVVMCVGTLSAWVVVVVAVVVVVVVAVDAEMIGVVGELVPMWVLRVWSERINFLLKIDVIDNRTICGANER